MKLRGLSAVGAVLGGLLLVFASAGPAGAHVGVKADQAAAGGYAVLTFSVPHGCEGSPTTKIAIKIPESITTTTPTVAADWEVEAVRAKLAEPQTDSHGAPVTDRVDQVVYTARTPLPDGLRQTFEVQVKLPDDAAGSTLSFPTVQTCAEGETAWIQLPSAGQDPDSLDHPAPAIEVGPAAADASDPTPASEEPTVGASVGWTADWMAPAGLVAGVAGLVLGGLALIRTRRRP